MEAIDPRWLERLHETAFPHSPADALRHAEAHEAAGAPDLSRFDDTIVDEEDGLTDRERARRYTWGRGDQGCA